MPKRLDLVSSDRHRLALEGQSVEYVLVRRRGRRGVGLKVDETGLTVSAPATLSRSRVEALVRESEQWVLRKIREWSGRQVPEVAWVDGASLPFLGGTLALRARAGARNEVERQGDELWVQTRRLGPEAVRRAVTDWYKRAALVYLEARVTELAERAGLPRPHVALSSALTRWGSCNSRREVRLAWRLIKAPGAMIDYVICHELAHLRHMNHSRAFWAEVARQCPDYRRLRDGLCAADHLYRSF